MRCAWGNGSSPSLLPIANFCVTHTHTHTLTHTQTQRQTHLRGRWCVIAWAKVNRSHLLCCSIAWAIWEAHRQAFFASCLFDWLTDRRGDGQGRGGVWEMLGWGRPSDCLTGWLADWQRCWTVDWGVIACINVWRLSFWLLTGDQPPLHYSPLIVGLTNAWDNCVAKNVDSLRICRFLLSIQIAGCEKRVANTFSLLASFFLYFPFAFW